MAAFDATRRTKSGEKKISISIFEVENLFREPQERQGTAATAAAAASLSGSSETSHCQHVVNRDYLN